MGLGTTIECLLSNHIGNIRLFEQLGCNSHHIHQTILILAASQHTQEGCCTIMRRGRILQHSLEIVVCRTILCFVISKLCYAHARLFDMRITIHICQRAILLNRAIILTQLIETIGCIILRCNTIASLWTEGSEIGAQTCYCLLIIAHNILQFGCHIYQRILLR